MWKDIKGYEGLYQVSDNGDVRSLDRHCTGSRNRLLKGRTLKQTKTTTGYNKVELCKDGHSISKKVHRLVAIAFIQNPNNLPCVNHIDNNPSNNNASNLEWCTQKENVAHAIKIGAKANTSKPRVATDEVIESVLEEYIPYDREHSIRAIARRLGIPDATIYSGITRYRGGTILMIKDDRKIKLGGGYWLCNDQYCCWISKEYTTKEGKHKGETYLRRCSGYTANVGEALESFCERHMREINASSVNSLIKEIRSLKTLVNTFKENI